MIEPKHNRWWPTILALTMTAAVLMAGDARAQAKVNQHDLLRGATKLPDPASWPDSITLPKAWEDGFRELAERTRRTGLEHGACLQLASEQSSAEQLVQRADDLQQYAQLRDGADAAAADRKLREVRAAFQRAGMRAAATEYSLGHTQSGTDTRILVHGDASQCPTAALGIVHTHPVADPGSEFPSPQDMRLILSERHVNSHLSAVVALNGQACLMIAGPRGDNSWASDDDWRARLRRFATWMLNDIDVAYRYLTSDRARGDSRPAIEVISELSEAHLRASGRAGMYCGELGKPFARVVSRAQYGAEPDRNRGLVLYSKALALMWSAVSEEFDATEPFAFNDQLDEPFLQYLRRRIKPSDQALAKTLQGEFDFLLDALLAVELPLPDGSKIRPFPFMEVRGGEMQVPNYVQYRSLTQRMRRSFDFLPFLHDQIFLIEVQPDGQTLTNLAMFQPRTQNWYRFNRRTMELVWHEPDKGKLTRGRAVLARCGGNTLCPKFDGPAQVTDANGTRRVDFLYKP